MSRDDANLVSRCLAGDKDAFDALVARYERPVYNLVYRVVGNHHDAQEITQDAFVRAYQALPTFRQGAGFYTWLYRIATNLSLDEIRRRRRRPVVLDGDMTQGDDREDPQDALVQGETRHVVHAALQTLPPEHRTIIVLRDLLDLTYEEIAQIQHLPLGTVKSRLNRARRMLRRRLSDGQVGGGLHAVR